MPSFNCSVCGKFFASRRNLQRHISEVHNRVCNFSCNICGKPLMRNERLQEHLLSHSGVRQLSVNRVTSSVPKRPRQHNDITFAVKHSSHFKNLVCLTLQTATQFTDLWTMYNRAKLALKQLLKSHLERLRMLKFDFILKLRFQKAADPNETICCYFHSKVSMVSHSRQISSLILDAFKVLTKQVEDYIERGSGWVVEFIEELVVHISKYQPIKGATYLPLPDKLRNRKAVVNVKNFDNKCFMWSVLAALHPVPRKSKGNNTSHYTSYVNELNFEGIHFPVELDAIPIFEHLNDLSINVYGYDDEQDTVRILNLSDHKEAQTKINLLLYNQQHYCYIKDIERLLNSQTTPGRRQFQCHLCLGMFYSIEKRDRHAAQCHNPDHETVKMPENRILKFINFHKMHRQPYIIYADFECILQKHHTCIPHSSKSHTTAYQKHIPCGYGLAEVFGCCFNTTRLAQTCIYRGEEPVQKFLEQIIQWGETYQQRYNQQRSVQMTEDSWNCYRNATSCNICKKPLEQNRVIDHCHFCAVYRGACHSNCNMKYRLCRDVVVVMHNLRRYDGHLILERLGEVAQQRKGVEIFVIPKGFDDYLTFSLRLRYNKSSWSLKFIDSFQFMSASLSTLVENLRHKGDDKFTHMASYFNRDQLPHLLRKGVYPYDYMDSWHRFAEMQLPSIGQFKSNLKDEDISTEDYQHAHNVWNKFNISNLGEYHDLYLLTDVLLLADVFENFRLFCLTNYELDPAHYFTSPSFSWDACLKMTSVEMELLSDPDMYTFIESGIRGGISIITHRYAKANNSYMVDYDASQPSTYIMYLDANNLYGWTMTCPLPLRSFRWLDDDQIQQLNVFHVSDNSNIGYIFELDLEYPEHLHPSHNDYPLAAEQMQVTDNMLSPYCNELKQRLNVKSAKVVKLIPNFRAKSHYIVHYRSLKMYLRLGLRVVKVHKVLAFEQEAWMTPFIEFNTEMRKKASSAFEKNLFKLFNNSVFGKTMENVRKYIDIKLVCKEEKVVKLASKLEYSGFKVIADSLWAVKMKQATVKLNKPIYVGFTVLDLSKLLMYDFHYNYIVSKYKSNAKLLFTDTDSLCYCINTDNIYADMHNDADRFDFSDYPKNHECYSVVNKKIMGKFKDELCGIPVSEFVGLRAKMYSLLDSQGHEKKRAKGVKKSVVARQVKHEMYKNVLFDGTLLKHCMKFIRPEGYSISSVIQNKTSLSAYDDKRYIANNAYSSYAYGHCNIPE